MSSHPNSGQRHDRTSTEPPAAAAAASASSSAAASSSSSSLQTVGLVVKREPWEVAPSEVEFSAKNLIGEGFFGCVYRAKWREMTVALKKLKNVRAGEAVNFAKEVALCSQIRHPHLVQFLAASTTKGNLFIVSEWLSGGSLHAFIHEKKAVGGVRYNRAGHLTLLRLASEIAKGMLYLHAAKLIHRDLSSANVLLSASLVAKVSDFGLSRPVADQSLMSGAGGNLLYLAPESFLLAQFTEASDCFAFGVLLNEMFTGQVPFKGLNGALAASECANRGARPALAVSTPVGVVRLIVSCWAHDPTQRPTFRQVLQTIEELSSEIAAEVATGETSGPAASAGSSTESHTPSSSGDTESSGRSSRKSKGKKQLSQLSGASSTQPSGVTTPSAPSTPSSASTRAASSAASTPKSTKSKASRASAATGSASDEYNRPLTPEHGEKSEDGDGDTPPALHPPLSSGHSHPAATIIGPDPAVTPRDIRLLMVCLKKHMPAHEAFVLHKPLLTAIDIHCDPSNKKAKSSGAAARSGATNAEIDGRVASTPAYRSRSEGDTDEADGKPRAHTCSPSFIAPIQPYRAPQIGELVLCRARRATDSGAEYELLEYTQPAFVGMAQVHELTKRKMRSISKLVSLNTVDVLRVLHVDEQRRMVDLSKKDVSDLIRSTTMTFWRQSEAAHHCVLAAARALNICSYDLYANVVWPLARRYEFSVWKLLRLSLVSPVMTLGEWRECACLQMLHHPTPSTSTTHQPQILASPRVLPEIARRCDFHRVHLDLSRLALETFPLQLMAAEGTDSTEPTDESEGSSKPRKHRSSNPRRTSSAIPADRSLVSSMKSLNLEENPLKVLPDRIGDFTKLMELNVNGCSLEDLPIALASCNGLSRLYAFNNRFSAIPAVIRQLVQITQLNLSRNPIAAVQIGDLSTLTKLLELSLAHCELTTVLPGTLPASIQTLSLQSNKLARFPIALFQLPNIVSLELQHNAIDAIPAPTPSIAAPALLYLEWLDLSSNKITSIADTFFGECLFLTWINLSHNLLTSLPSSLFSIIRRRDQLEEKSTADGKQSTSGSTSTLPSSPVGLQFLNLQFQSGQLKPCVSVDVWNELAAIPQFLFDTESVPNGKTISIGSKPPSTTLQPPAAAPSMPSTPQLAPASPKRRSMLDWTVQEVVAWLHAEGLAEFAPAFEENLIAGSTLVDLDKNDLRDDLGIKALGTQKKVLKLIQVQKEQIQAAMAASAAATPSSLSLHSSPQIAPVTNVSELAFSTLSLGPRATDGGPPPSVAVRRANSTLSPSVSMSSVAMAAASAGIGCDMRTCERIKSTLLRAAVSSEPMCRPLLLRCVVALLIGNIYQPQDARAALDAALAAGRAASLAHGGAVSGPFSGLSAGPRSQLVIAPLLEPMYLLSVPCLMPADGNSLVEAAISAMSASLEKSSGRAKVAMRPYIVEQLPTETFGGAAANGSTAITAGGPPVALHRAGSVSQFSGEIVAALDSFRQCKEDELAEQLAKKAEAAKKKQERRDAAWEQKKAKKREKEKAAQENDGKETPLRAASGSSSVPAGAFD